MKSGLWFVKYFANRQKHTGKPIVVHFLWRTILNKSKLQTQNLGLEKYILFKTILTWVWKSRAPNNKLSVAEKRHSIQTNQVHSKDCFFPSKQEKSWDVKIKQKVCPSCFTDMRGTMQKTQERLYFPFTFHQQRYKSNDTKLHTSPRKETNLKQRTFWFFDVNMSEQSLFFKFWKPVWSWEPLNIWRDIFMVLINTVLFSPICSCFTS